MNLTIFSFLSCLQWWKQTRNEMKFQLHSFCFHFCSVWWLLAILVKRNPSSFFLDSDLRKCDFDQIGRNDRNLNNICKACFVSYISFGGLLKTRNVERGLKLLVRNNWWNSIKKGSKKSVIFRICQTGWNSLAIGLAEWLKLVAIKQITISTTIELDFLLLLSASEGNAVFSSFNSILSAFLEWLFREQEHLKCENENEMEKYLLLANQQWVQMNIFHNECCF